MRPRFQNLKTTYRLMLHRVHNSFLRRRLLPFVETGDAAGLLALLNGLSRDSFRDAGALLGDDLLPSMNNTAAFRRLFLGLVPTNSKAYLGTFLKGYTSLIQKGVETLDADFLKAYLATSPSDIDCRKTLEALLPLATNPADGRLLLRLFGRGNAETQAAALLRLSTPLGCYLLFQTCKLMEADETFLRRVVQALLRKADRLSMNSASIITKYFDVKNIGFIFALRLEPWQHSRLDESYESFKKILLSI